MTAYLKVLATFLALSAIAIVLTACSSSEDRGGGRDLFSSDDQFDETIDADTVVLVRNANDFPNFVLICADGNAYVAARSRNAAGAQTTVVPDPQRQGECAR